MVTFLFIFMVVVIFVPLFIALIVAISHESNPKPFSETTKEGPKSNNVKQSEQSKEKSSENKKEQHKPAVQHEEEKQKAKAVIVHDKLPEEKSKPAAVSKPKAVVVSKPKSVAKEDSEKPEKSQNKEKHETNQPKTNKKTTVSNAKVTIYHERHVVPKDGLSYRGNDLECNEIYTSNIRLLYSEYPYASIVIAKETIFKKYLALRTKDKDIILLDDSNIRYYTVMEKEGISIAANAAMHALLGPIGYATARTASGQKVGQEKIIFIKLKNKKRILVRIEEGYQNLIRSKNKRSKKNMIPEDWEWAQERINFLAS